jgi:hypothetical protein
VHEYVVIEKLLNGAFYRGAAWHWQRMTHIGSAVLTLFASKLVLEIPIPSTRKLVHGEQLPNE